MSPRPNDKWYITVAAAKQWMAIQGYPAEDDGDWWDTAEKELFAMQHDPSLVHKKTLPGGRIQEWHVYAPVRGHRAKIELTVSTDDRPEGHLPQLVRVRIKTQSNFAKRNRQ